LEKEDKRIAYETRQERKKNKLYNKENGIWKMRKESKKGR